MYLPAYNDWIDAGKPDMEADTDDRWIIACAAWNNVTVDKMRAMCAKDDKRMPEGSREAWQRVYDAIARTYHGTD